MSNANKKNRIGLGEKMTLLNISRFRPRNINVLNTKGRSSKRTALPNVSSDDPTSWRNDSNLRPRFLKSHISQSEEKISNEKCNPLCEKRCDSVL